MRANAATIRRNMVVRILAELANRLTAGFPRERFARTFQLCRIFRARQLAAPKP